jgi:hypothetical protein
MFLDFRWNMTGAGFPGAAAFGPAMIIKGGYP